MPGRVHSGYFLRRQYRAYLGTKPGWADDLLIAKITNLRHGRILTLGFKTQVCHLSARPFYHAIGKEHNRHRRMRSDLSIRTKLMALDYVLAGADPVYLATEREKVEFFIGRLGIDVDCLPTKTYRLQTTAETTERYFVDKFPIGIPRESTSPLVVSFTFVDEGPVAAPGFETWLEQYSTLMGALERFRVVFVATTDMNFRWAEYLFQEGCCGSSSKQLSHVARRLPER